MKVTSTIQTGGRARAVEADSSGDTVEQCTNEAVRGGAAGRHFGGALPAGAPFDGTGVRDSRPPPRVVFLRAFGRSTDAMLLFVVKKPPNVTEVRI